MSNILKWIKSAAFNSRLAFNQAYSKINISSKQIAFFSLMIGAASFGRNHLIQKDKDRKQQEKTKIDEEQKQTIIKRQLRQQMLLEQIKFIVQIKYSALKQYQNEIIQESKKKESQKLTINFFSQCIIKRLKQVQKEKKQCQDKQVLYHQNLQIEILKTYQKDIDSSDLKQIIQCYHKLRLQPISYEEIGNDWYAQHAEKSSQAKQFFSFLSMQLQKTEKIFFLEKLCTGFELMSKEKKLQERRVLVQKYRKMGLKNAKVKNIAQKRESLKRMVDCIQIPLTQLTNNISFFEEQGLTQPKS